MITLHKSFAIITIALFSFFFVSCNNNEQPSIKKLPTPIGNSWLDFPVEDLDEDCFALMCSQRSELTEIPRYLNQEEVDSTINALYEMSEQAFCEWFQAHPHHNPILTSFAYFDSIIIAACTNLGLDISDINHDDGDTHVSELTEEVIDILQNGNSALYSTVSTTSGKTIYRPIGDLNLAALADSHGQVIVGYVYYRFIGNYLLSMPLTIYMEAPTSITTDENIENIRNELNNMGLSEEYGDYGVTELPQEVSNSTVADDNPNIEYNATVNINPDQSEYKFMVYSGDEQYGSFIRLYCYEYKGWFHNRRDAICYVENYFFSPNTAQGVSTKKVSMSLDAYFVTTGTNEPNRTWAFHFTENGRYKSHSFRDRLRFNKSEPLDAPIVLSDVHVVFSWNNTATVIMNY